MNGFIARPHIDLQRDIYSKYRFSFIESFFLYLRSFVLDYADITNHIPLGSNIVDIGCGYGILANYLALTDPACKVRGLDIDPLRIQKARQSIGDRTNIAFDTMDFMVADFSRTTAVLLIDVMHYFNYTQQDEVIRTIASQLNAGAIFIFRTPDTKPRWRFYWNYMHEAIMIGSSITKTASASLFFRNSEGLLDVLKQNGFAVKIYPNKSIFPYSDTLYICTKIGV